MNYEIYLKMSENDKNKFVKQYEKLINKIIGQFARRGCASWDDLTSMAYEGFMNAIMKYDENRSDQNFTQFAAYSIRFHILNSLTHEVRTVKMSGYHQKKALDAGETTWNMVRFEDLINNRKHNEDSYNDEVLSQFIDDRDFSYETLYETIYDKLESEFSERDCDIFYRSVGLKNYGVMKGKDIAEELGISACAVSTKIKRIVNFLRKDKELCEMLAKL